MEWKAKQKEFLTAVEMGRCIFLSGKAGTGKSTVAREAMRILKENKVKFISVAPTGMAAAAIEGVTIHSFFRIPPQMCMMDYDNCQKINDQRIKVLRKVRTIFIDEGSMVRADLLDAMHMTMIKNGIKRGLKGKQVVFIGDMKQLPPIASDNERAVLKQKYDGITIFDAHCIKDMQLLQIDLDEIVRQDDEEFINALNIVRDGGKSEYFRRFITNEASGVVLSPYNKVVNEYNERGLKLHDGKLYQFDAVIEGDAKPIDFKVDAEIRVKSGCKVMYLVNSKDNPLVNGSIGELRIDERKELTEPRLLFKVGNTEWLILPHTFTKYDYVYNKDTDEIERIEKGSITQYPIRLAYAMTIHKSQGMTFEDMTADFRGGCFQREQYYVALSRATGPKALRIII
jgi:ATP-dependent exoDNAse (exonuclease V) alpha subunit